MKKSDMIDAISEVTEIKKKDVGEMIEAMDAIASRALAAGNTVAIGGLGKLKPVHRAAREGRNPKTGEVVQIPAKRDAKFTASKALRDSLGE